MNSCSKYCMEFVFHIFFFKQNDIENVFVLPFTKLSKKFATFLSRYVIRTTYTFWCTKLEIDINCCHRFFTALIGIALTNGMKRWNSTQKHAFWFISIAFVKHTGKLSQCLSNESKHFLLWIFGCVFCANERKVIRRNVSNWTMFSIKCATKKRTNSYQMFFKW